MSRSRKDKVGGHLRREVAGDELGGYGAIVWKPHAKRWAKRRCARAQRRNNKPDIRCPELIYPYLNMLNPHFVRGSYIIFDFCEDDGWEDDYDWYCDMLGAYWAEEYDDYTGPDDYYEDPYDYDYDPWDYDYDY